MKETDRTKQLIFVFAATLLVLLVQRGLAFVGFLDTWQNGLLIFIAGAVLWIVVDRIIEDANRGD